MSAELMALTKKRMDFAGQPDRLRQSVVDFFARQSGEWELRVQLCTDLDSMPIEDAKTVWPEDRSPYVAVARIVIPPQIGWSATRSKVVDDAGSPLNSVLFVIS